MCYQTVDGFIKELKSHQDPFPKFAPAVPPEIQRGLWKTAVPGPRDPSTLINALLWKHGMLFALRGGEELRKARRSNVAFEEESESKVQVIYTQLLEKNHQGGLNDNNPPKFIRHSEDPSEPNSFYRLFNRYLSKLPPACDLSNSLWFATNMAGYQKGSRYWYKDQAMGIHKLGSFVKKIMAPYGKKLYKSLS